MRAHAFILLSLCVVFSATRAIVPDVSLAEPTPPADSPPDPNLDAVENKPRVQTGSPSRHPEEKALIDPVSSVSSVTPGAEMEGTDFAELVADEPTRQRNAPEVQLRIDSTAQLDASPSILLGDTEPPSAPIVVEKVKKIDEVFVPLREWKEKKLQDIESRVKQRAEGDRGSDPLACDDRQRRASLNNHAFFSGDANSALYLSKRQLRFRDLFARTCPANWTYYGEHLKTLNEAPENVVPLPAPVTPQNVEPIPLSSLQSREGATNSQKRKIDERAVRSHEAVALSGEDRWKVPLSNPATVTDNQNDEVSVFTIDKSKKREVSQVGDEVVRLVNAALNELAESPSQDEAEDVTATLKRLRSLGKQVGIERDPSPAPCATIGEKHGSESVPSNVSIRACVGKCEAQIAPSEKPAFITAPTGDAPDSKKRENMSLQNRREMKNKADNFAFETADAGFGKVGKKYFNFASQVAGAQILAASANAVGAKNIINEDSDKYMLVPCVGDGIGGSRWVDIELSEYGFLDSVQTANFEHYSSTALKLAVLGAQKYPPKKWNVLGVFDFANDRSLQTFHISGLARRKVSRFLRVVYAGKQGHEYYCPISIFRAFGKNLIADLKDGLEGKQTARSETYESSANAQNKYSSQSEVSDDTPLMEKPKKVRATDITGIEAVMKRAAAFVHDQEFRTDKKDDPNSAKPKRDETGRAKGELSTDDQILLNVIREETLSPVSGDDNIFRQVARMIRLLELNQSLTNQYIDTHLARYAAALASVQSEAAKGQEAGAVAQARVASLGAGVEEALQQMRASAFRRDMFLGALVALVGFLVGTHWVMWTALNRARINQSAAEVSEVTASLSFDPRRPPQTSSEAPKQRITCDMTDVRRRRKKGRRPGGASLSNGDFDSPGMGKSRTRLMTNGNKSKLLESNSFHLLSTK